METLLTEIVNSELFMSLWLLKYSGVQYFLQKYSLLTGVKSYCSCQKPQLNYSFITTALSIIAIFQHQRVDKSAYYFITDKHDNTILRITVKETSCSVPSKLNLLWWTHTKRREPVMCVFIDQISEVFSAPGWSRCTQFLWPGHGCVAGVSGGGNCSGVMVGRTVRPRTCWCGQQRNIFSTFIYINMTNVLI